MALALPKLTVPKLAPLQLPQGKKRILMIAGAVVLVAIAAWLAWQYFGEAPPPPPAKAPAASAAPKPVTAGKSVAGAGATPATAAKAVPVAGPAQAKLIDDVLDASGLRPQINQLPAQMIAGIREASQHKAAPAITKALEAAVAGAFSAEAFQDHLKADLKNNFDQQRLQTLLGELSSAAGKRMIALELATSSQQDLARYASSLAKTPLPAQRSSLIKRIDAASRASDLAVAIAFAAIDALVPALAGKQAGAVDKAIEAQRGAATDAIRNATLVNLAYSYQSASDADLETYAKLAESESAKWFAGIVYASLLEQAKSAATLASEHIGELAAKPAAPERVAAGAKRIGSKSRADARACLARETNAAIIRCAEDYR